MDFSQLPKMSKTPSTPTASESATSDEASTPLTTDTPKHDVPRPQAIDYRNAYAAPEASFGGVWLSLIAGVIFLALGATFGRFLLAKLSGKDFATGVNWTAGPNEGQPVTYFELQGGTAWTDAGLFLMGVALLLDALILGILAARGKPNRGLVWIAVILTSIAMLINAGVVVHLFSMNILPLTSLIALAVGGFVVFDHGPMLRKPEKSSVSS